MASGNTLMHFISTNFKIRVYRAKPLTLQNLFKHFLASVRPNLKQVVAFIYHSEVLINDFNNNGVKLLVLGISARPLNSEKL